MLVDLMQTEAELVVLRIWLQLAEADAIGGWLDQYVNTTNDPYPDVLELFELPYEQQVGAFVTLVRTRFGFEPDSPRGSEVADELLARLCTSVLACELPVPKFCQTISLIDAKYTTPGLRAPYPTKLADLWNGCDWCDEAWTLDGQPHLGELLLRHSVQ
jgi:hypothetical protein